MTQQHPQGDILSAEKLNEHFNRQQVLEKEHTEFYSELVTLRSTVEHLRLRENRLTAENTQLQKDYVCIKESAAIWHDRYKAKCQEYTDWSRRRRRGDCCS